MGVLRQGSFENLKKNFIKCLAGNCLLVNECLLSDFSFRSNLHICHVTWAERVCLGQEVGVFMADTAAGHRECSAYLNGPY